LKYDIEEIIGSSATRGKVFKEENEKGESRGNKVMRSSEEGDIRSMVVTGCGGVANGRTKFGSAARDLVVGGGNNVYVLF